MSVAIVREPGSDDVAPADRLEEYYRREDADVDAIVADIREQQLERQLEQQPKTRLGLQPLSVLLDLKIPETEWLMSPWLEKGSIAALVAPPNLGKTLLAFWFATQVAASGKRVAIIEEEGGLRGFQKRIDRAVMACGGREKCASISWTFKPRLSLMHWPDVRKMQEELKGHDFVIIDSLARVTTGMEENDASAMGQIVEALDGIREATGACALSIHHTGKAKWKPGEVPRLEDGRGSSALAAGLDTVLALAPVADKEKGVVQFELHITKQRDEDNQVEPLHVRITMTGPAAVVETEVAGASDPDAEALRMEVLGALPASAPGVSKTWLERTVRGYSAQKIRRTVDQLVSTGQAVRLQNGRFAVPYQPRPTGSGRTEEPHPVQPVHHPVGVGRDGAGPVRRPDGTGRGEDDDKDGDPWGR